MNQNSDLRGVDKLGPTAAPGPSYRKNSLKQRSQPKLPTTYEQNFSADKKGNEKQEMQEIGEIP